MKICLKASPYLSFWTTKILALINKERGSSYNKVNYRVTRENVVRGAFTSGSTVLAGRLKSAVNS